MTVLHLPMSLQVGPSVAEMMTVLGQENTTRRLQYVIDHLPRDSAVASSWQISQTTCPVVTCHLSVPLETFGCEHTWIINGFLSKFKILNFFLPVEAFVWTFHVDFFSAHDGWCHRTARNSPHLCSLVSFWSRWLPLVACFFYLALYKWF